MPFLFMEKYFRIYCHTRHKNKKGKTQVCFAMLGDIPVTAPIKVRFYCRSCKPTRLWEVEYRNGVIKKRVVHKNEALSIDPEIVVVEPSDV